MSELCSAPAVELVRRITARNGDAVLEFLIV